MNDIELMPEIEPLRIPLRFAKSQARVLEAIVTQLEQRSIQTEDVTLFKQAAEVTRKGEALIVECTSRNEVQAIADGFVRFGVSRPTVGV